MSEERKCPMCWGRDGRGNEKKPAPGGGILTPSPGVIEQSGQTHLPTTVWTCSTKHCQYKEWERSRAAWKTDEVKDIRTKEVLTKPRDYTGETEGVPS